MKVIVIGGGPAGILAAISSAENGNDVTILEKMNSLGKKLLITGKGRCNITSSIPIEEFISNIPGNGRFLYSCFQNYTNEDIINLLKEQHVEVKEERGNRIFPVSDHSQDVLNALIRKLNSLKVEIKTNARVKEILVEEENDAKKVTFKLKDVKVKEVTTGTAGVYIVDPDGTDMNLKLANDNTLSVSGLAAGTYYLDETATVPGYNLLKSTIKIVISPTYGTDGKLTGYTADTSKIDIDNQNTVTVSVENKKGFTLPSTGGQGMVALVAAGICLMAAMAALMVSYMRKRRNA